MSNHDQHDSEGNNNMDAVSRAYRDAGRSDANEMAPPAALDDAIRAAARRAVHAGPHPVGRSWIRRWTPQLAVAAVVVLSVSVVFVAIDEQPELAPAPIQKVTQARRADTPAAALAPRETQAGEAAPSTTMASDAVKKKSAVQAGTVGADAQGARQTDVPSVKEERSPASSSPPPPAQRAAATPAPLAPATPAHAPPSPAVANVAPAPFPAAAAETVAPARKESRADASVAAAQEPKVVAERTAAAGALRSPDARSVPAKSVLPAVATSAVPAAPAVLAQAPMMKQIAPSAADTALPDRARRDMQTSGAAGLHGNADEASQPSGKHDENERPGPWLKRLLELREQGKFKELREELARFRKAHPDVVLPKSLTELPAE